MFKAETKNDFYIVRVDQKDAAIDINNVNDLKKILKEGISQGFKKLIIDFTNVVYIDSSGLGCLMDILKEIKEQNGEVGLLSISKEVLEVFTATKIAQFFKYYKSVSV
jgi:anti-sigma B factor antagonist